MLKFIRNLFKGKKQQCNIHDVSNSVCEHWKGSSRGIIKGVEHWQCVKCKQWFAN